MEHGITHEVTILILQLAFILFVARVSGEIFERYLKQPSVLGELAQNPTLVEKELKQP